MSSGTDGGSYNHGDGKSQGCDGHLVHGSVLTAPSSGGNNTSIPSCLMVDGRRM